MVGAFVEGNETETEPGAVNQTPAVELDAGASAGTRDLHFRRCIDALQHGIRRVAGAIAVGVVADEPTAVPVARTSGAVGRTDL